METTTAVVGGGVLVLFGGALLLWCAAEVRLRHVLSRRGVPALARVVAEGDAYGELDSAPLLSFAAPASSGGTGAGLSEVVVTRPRGRTPLRRPAHLVPGTAVRVAYDPRRPNRVVLTADEAGRAVVTDLMWTALGAASLVGGLCLLAVAA